MDKNNEKLLTVKQAATFLSVSVPTIRRWAQLKQLVGLKVGTRGDWRFSKEALLKMFKQNDGKPIEKT